MTRMARATSEAQLHVEDDELDDIKEFNDGQDVSTDGKQDIDLDKWLGGADLVPEILIGQHLLPNGKQRLNFSAITADEERQVRRMARKMNKRTGRPALDADRYANLIISWSLHKAKGMDFKDLAWVGVADSHQMGKRLAGEMTSLMRSIMELSGLDKEREQAMDAADFFA